MKFLSIHTVKFYSYIVVVIFFCTGCIEEIEPEPIDFKSVITIEATITNAMQKQTVLVNNSFNFGDEGPVPESGAYVMITDDTGTTYNFNETSPGYYESIEQFAAMSGRVYQLEVKTSDGSVFLSKEEQLSADSTIDSLYAERTTENNIDGIAIKVESFDPQGNSRNYRYEYEETFKIIAPKWTSKRLVEDEETADPCDLKIIEREIDERICYKTELSSPIIQFNTNNLTEDRVQNLTIRFIESENYILSHRYSILVKQYIQSDMAYNFYATLANFSENENLFSQIQHGFLQGNISGITDGSEEVLGFFEVSAVDQKRIFFDFEDFFPGEPLPPYIIDCMEVAPPIRRTPEKCTLLPIVELNEVRFVKVNDNPDPLEGPFFVVDRPCGDCTALGSNMVPDFWID